jgi:hypothetical protein
MSTLTINNGYRASLVGLGKIRGLEKLSQKRITKAVREELRRNYGLSHVAVSCDATLASDGWHGSCTIHDKDFEYMCS